MVSFKTYNEQWRDTRLSNSPGRVGVIRMFENFMLQCEEADFLILGHNFDLIEK